jgi:protocatechuate 3,4-dioxygenase beta subunit
MGIMKDEIDDITSTHRKLTRREAFAALSAAAAALAAACGSSPTTPTTTSSATTTTGGGTTSTTCALSPEETAGPYPDRLGMVNNATFFRQDVTEGKAGLPLTLTLSVVKVSTACTPITNAAVEIWQCDATGNYSEYSQPGYNGTGQTFLRGLQTTDANGNVTFKTIYPGWYAGRATHIHVQVFVNGSVVKTTQIAFPENISASVYSTGVYAAHGQNTTTNARDNVFSDGTDHEMATVTGDSSAGYAATLVIGV